MELINQDIQSHRAHLDEIIKDLHELTLTIRHQELAAIVSDLRNRIHEPFLFVVVGEVKAGKSSFINALLDTGEEIAKTGPQPITDMIQQITYGEEAKEIRVNPYLKQVQLPIPILKEIGIVDTPGTNTIVAHHQEITESYIPASDLIVFVFEAKNPYRQSAWDFFQYIHKDWQKKIIFVLQQKDLMSEADLQVNIGGLKDFAQQKGIAAPRIFALSAKEEIDGQSETSGFESLRTYIREHITGGKAPLLKLTNNVHTAIHIHQKIGSGLQDRHKQLEADRHFRQDIHQTLDEQEARSFKQVDLFVENLLASFDQTVRLKTGELQQGLSFPSLLRRSFSAIFSSKSSVREWLDQLIRSLEAELTESLGQRLQTGVIDLADSIQQMAKLIDLKIRNSETILRNDHAVFSDIAERRLRVLEELQTAFASFIHKTDSFFDDNLFPEKQAISPNIATGSGLAAIGIILAAVTQGMVFDITGGVLTTIGLVFAGVSSSIKRKKIMQSFSAELDKGRNRIQQTVDQKLKSYIHHLKNRIDHNFDAFDQMLAKEDTQLKVLEHRHNGIQDRLHAIEQELPKLPL